MGNIGMESGGYQFGHRYVIPIATGHVVQSLLKVEDGDSFFVKKNHSLD